MEAEQPKPTYPQLVSGAETIEQWYTDYFERDDPAGFAPEALRRLNLFNAMTNRGFSQVRAWTIVNWLMRCRGILRDFDDRTKPNSRRAKRIKLENASLSSVEPQQVVSTPRKKIENINHTLPPKKTTVIDCDGVNEDEDSNNLLEICDDEPTEEEIRLLFGITAAPVTPETSPQKQSQTRRSSSSKHRLDSTSGNLINESEYIRALQHRLRFFDIVYADQLPPDDPTLEFDYTKGPFPRAIRQRKTQVDIKKRCTCVNAQAQIKTNNDQVKNNNIRVMNSDSQPEKINAQIMSNGIQDQAPADENPKQLLSDSELRPSIWHAGRYVGHNVPFPSSPIVPTPHTPPTYIPATYWSLFEPQTHARENTCTCSTTQHPNPSTSIIKDGISFPSPSQTMTPVEKDLDTLNRRRVTARLQKAVDGTRYQDIEDHFAVLYGIGAEKRFSCGERVRWQEILQERKEARLERERAEMEAEETDGTEAEDDSGEDGEGAEGLEHMDVDEDEDEFRGFD